MDLLLQIEDMMIYTIWICSFLASLVFFSLSQNKLPALLIHFVFLLDAYVFSQISVLTGDINFFLFTILSSFYAIESLRNESSHILAHFVFLIGVVYFVDYKYGINVLSYSINSSTLAILCSIILCRGVMSMLESRDVVVREIVTKKPILVPIEPDEEQEQKIKKEIDSAKTKASELQLQLEKEIRNNDILQKEFDYYKKQNMKQKATNEEMIKKYFYLMANMRFDLNYTFEDNINNILTEFLKITKAKYTALITSSKYDDNGNPLEKEEIFLSNSVFEPNLEFDEENLLRNETVNDYIHKVAETKQVFYQTEFVNIDGYELGNIHYVPVMHGSDFRGILVQVYGKNHEDNVHYFNMCLMTAYQIYNAFQNESLYKQAKDEANMDGFLKIYNKKYLMESLPMFFNNAYNYNTNLGLIFVDVDYFKEVNDTYGHDKGDEVLVFVTKTIQEEIRSSDMVFRYGGDEFVILMSGARKEKIQKLGDIIIEKLKNSGITITIDGEERPLSASMGAKIYSPIENNVNDADELLKLADEALYKSKNGGKGRLTID